MNKKFAAFVLIAAAVFLTACGHGGAAGGGQTDVHTPASSAHDTPREETKNDLTDSTSLPEGTKEAEAMVINYKSNKIQQGNGQKFRSGHVGLAGQAVSALSHRRLQCF